MTDNNWMTSEKVATFKLHGYKSFKLREEGK